MSGGLGKAVVASAAGPFLATEGEWPTVEPATLRPTDLMRSTRFNSMLLLAAAALVACGGGGGSFGGDVDTALLTRDGGDVMLVGGGRLPYEITSDRYRRWEAARAALRAQKVSFALQLDPLRVSEADIQRAVSFFERNAKARRAVEGAGLSVRDYVLTTIAVEQQMAVASGRPVARPRPAAAPAPAPSPESVGAELTEDTTMRAGPPAPDSGRRPARARARVDTVPVVDTVVVPVDPPPPPPDGSSPPAR